MFPAKDGEMGSEGRICFFWATNQLKSHGHCLATKSALVLAPDISTCPVPDSREFWVSWVGWHSVPSGNREGTQASLQPVLRAWGTYLTPSVNEQVDNACLPLTCQVAVKYQMREAILSHRSLWEGRPLLSTSDCAFTSVTSWELPVPVWQDK